MSIYYQNILNYFDNRSTNASAESFNAKIKAFRAQFRGVKNVEFFLID
jgi:transposase